MKGMRSCFREIIFFVLLFFRRSDCMAIGGYDENMRKGHEDWEFFIRLLDENSLVYQIPSPLFYYRVKEQSMITAAKQADVFNETEFISIQNTEPFMLPFLEAVHCTSFANCFICARSARRIEINGIEDFSVNI